MKLKYPDYLSNLVNVLKRLPGVGGKTAERFAFNLLSWPEENLSELENVIAALKTDLHYCENCGALMDNEKKCLICNDPHRDASIVCVVASAKDIFAMEHTGEYHGIYHVLGGLLSPLEGRHAEDMFFQTLLDRLKALETQEVIIALDSTLEGDATALYLKKKIEELDVKVSRLALGMPMGSSLDYLDEGTLGRALVGRAKF
ncbi:MAG: recombination mediator RecR [Chlamydiota bacterium]